MSLREEIFSVINGMEIQLCGAGNISDVERHEELKKYTDKIISKIEKRIDSISNSYIELKELIQLDDLKEMLKK